MYWTRSKNQNQSRTKLRLCASKWSTRQEQLIVASDLHCCDVLYWEQVLLSDSATICMPHVASITVTGVPFLLTGVY